MGMKAPTIIRAIEDDLTADKACVIQVGSTGESLLKRRLETMDPEDELVEGALTPRDCVLGYLEQAFPIHAQKLVEIDGNMVVEPLRDETGALVVSREALALRDAAMMKLMALAPIPSALDQILWAFGDEAVAEVTGRSDRAGAGGRYARSWGRNPAWRKDRTGFHRGFLDLPEIQRRDADHRAGSDGSGACAGNVAQPRQAADGQLRLGACGAHLGAGHADV